ncbi:MAG: hypothetical protein KC417_07230, partial [Myxococcales bacterium]|nr:hypothetical protein [Myxococcales bacterium]
QVRGGFRYPGPGSDVTGEAVGVNEWVYLEHNLFDADWHFLKSTDWKCSEGYKYLGSIAVNGSMERNKGVTEGAHWIILCGTDDDLRLETTCPSGFETRGWFRADLGGRTSSGVDVPAGATFMNWCVRQSECVGACWPSSVP